MLERPEKTLDSPVIFSSSSQNLPPRERTGTSGYECWHFDALSDDGSEAVIITFHDNFQFSSERYRNGHEADPASDHGAELLPAVCLTYFVNGKIVIRAVNEFKPGDFEMSPGRGRISIANSSFAAATADYGLGYTLHLELTTARNCTVKADLEWLSVEADLKPEPEEPVADFWNIVAPRSDVSGRITIVGRGKRESVKHFRGTGYHDQIRSEDDAKPRLWGRVHFADAIAVFQSLDRVGVRDSTSNLILSRDGKIREMSARLNEQDVVRDRYGLKVPVIVSLTADDDTQLSVRGCDTIQSGFLEVKMLSEITLVYDGQTRKGTGITEFADPERMRNPIVRWASNLSFGRGGRPPIY